MFEIACLAVSCVNARAWSVNWTRALEPRWQSRRSVCVTVKACRLHTGGNASSVQDHCQAWLLMSKGLRMNHAQPSVHRTLAPRGQLYAYPFYSSLSRSLLVVKMNHPAGLRRDTRFLLWTLAGSQCVCEKAGLSAIFSSFFCCSFPNNRRHILACTLTQSPVHREQQFQNNMVHFFRSANCALNCLKLAPNLACTLQLLRASSKA